MKHKSLKQVMHETAKDLHQSGVMNEQTMREFDAMCLPPVKNYSSKQIRLLRKRNHVSQAVFAAYLNTTSSTVQKWEQGKKQPSAIALKLLSLVERFGIALLAA